MTAFPIHQRAFAESALRRFKQILLVTLAWPFLTLLVGAVRGTLGADPVDVLTRDTGIWALNCLLLTLAMAPVRRFTGWSWPLRLRRMLGLYSFFYATLHLGTYLVFDQFFDGAEILKDVVKRPFITAGFLTYLMLAPLAITSTKAMMRRLGSRWKQLHRLVYLAAMGGALHYLWLVKRDITEPGLYIIVLCALLSARMMKRKTPARVARPPVAQPAYKGADGSPAAVLRTLRPAAVQWMAQQDGGSAPPPNSRSPDTSRPDEGPLPASRKKHRDADASRL